MAEVLKEVVSREMPASRRGNATETVHGEKAKSGSSGICQWRCSPSKLMNLCSLVFADPIRGNAKREAVKYAGFGGLLNICLHQLDRDLTTFLLRSYDKKTKSFVLGEGKVLTFGPEDVRRVYGLPAGDFAVDLKDSTTAEVRRLESELGFAAVSQNSRVKTQLLYKMLLSENNLTKFVKLFILYATGVLLCPSTVSDSSVSLRYGRVLDDLERVDHYDWCRHVYDDLVNGLEKLDPETKRPTIRGDLHFLTIHFLDMVGYDGEVRKTGAPTCSLWPKQTVYKKKKKFKSMGGFKEGTIFSIKKFGGSNNNYFNNLTLEEAFQRRNELTMETARLDAWIAHQMKKKSRSISVLEAIEDGDHLEEDAEADIVCDGEKRKGKMVGVKSKNKKQKTTDDADNANVSGGAMKKSSLKRKRDGSKRKNVTFREDNDEEGMHGEEDNEEVEEPEVNGNLSSSSNQVVATQNTPSVVALAQDNEVEDTSCSNTNTNKTNDEVITTLQLEDDDNNKHNQTAEEGYCNESHATASNLKSSAEIAPKLHRSDYYTDPPISELLVKEDKTPGYLARVGGFIIGRHGYGYIEFQGNTDIRGLDLDSLVHLDSGEVTVYPEEVNKKPPVGEGLNKPAVITLLNVKCVNKWTGEQYVEGKMAERFVEKLKRAARTQGAEFMSYDQVIGEWKFRVEHF